MIRSVVWFLAWCCVTATFVILAGLAIPDDEVLACACTLAAVFAAVFAMVNLRNAIERGAMGVR